MLRGAVSTWARALMGLTLGAGLVGATDFHRDHFLFRPASDREAAVLATPVSVTMRDQRLYTAARHLADRADLTLVTYGSAGTKNFRSGEPLGERRITFASEGPLGRAIEALACAGDLD